MIGVSDTLTNSIIEIIREEIDLRKYKAFFFGSRVSGASQEKSDIDVGILGDEPLPLTQIRCIKNRLEELPTLYTIDFVDMSDATEDFRTVALAHTIPITTTLHDKA